jgi:hypothetical protein
MMRCLLLLVIACGPSSQPASKPATSTKTRCEPMPKEGEPCGAGDSYCVISWGKPGGRSAALWCRDGKWVYEEEVNLPER